MPSTTFTDVAVTGALAVTGVSSGQFRQATQTLTASGAITITSGLVQLSHASTIIAATLAAPVTGDTLYIANSSASGTAAHTVTLPSGVTWDGTNNTLTMNAPGEAVLVVALSATRWLIMVSLGTVVLSTV